jgi:hypothetical protein
MFKNSNFNQNHTNSLRLFVGLEPSTIIHSHQSFRKTTTSSRACRRSSTYSDFWLLLFLFRSVFSFLLQQQPRPLSCLFHPCLVTHLNRYWQITDIINYVINRISTKTLQRKRGRSREMKLCQGPQRDFTLTASVWSSSPPSCKQEGKSLALRTIELLPKTPITGGSPADHRAHQMKHSP